MPEEKYVGWGKELFEPNTTEPIESKDITVKFDHKPTYEGIFYKMAELQDKLTQLYLTSCGTSREERYLNYARIMLQYQIDSVNDCKEI